MVETSHRFGARASRSGVTRSDVRNLVIVVQACGECKSMAGYPENCDEAVMTLSSCGPLGMGDEQVSIWLTQLWMADGSI